MDWGVKSILFILKSYPTAMLMVEDNSGRFLAKTPRGSIKRRSESSISLTQSHKSHRSMRIDAHGVLTAVHDNVLTVG